MSTIAVIAMVGTLHDQGLIEDLRPRLAEANYKVVFIDHQPDKDLYVDDAELGFPWDDLGLISEYKPELRSDWIAPLERLPYPVSVATLVQPDNDWAGEPLHTARGGVGKGTHNPSHRFRICQCVV